MKKSKKFVRITHRSAGKLLAKGPLGWAITPFEGNYYIGKKYLLTDAFRPNYIPGLCPYKFLYLVQHRPSLPIMRISHSYHLV